jgi:LysR family transcriptional regulator, glycine cleavage system transcriptional activator
LKRIYLWRRLRASDGPHNRPGCGVAQPVIENSLHAKLECIKIMPTQRWNLPPLELLPAFEAAARHLSFTKAGGELFLTQSAVSRQIQALEEDLGCKLFERRTRALLLTEQGQVLYRVAQAVLQEVHDTAEKVRAEPPARTVTVTTTPGFASLWLIPRLAGFTGAHPDIDVRISASYDLVRLERSGVDLAVRYAPCGSLPGEKPLFGEEMMPVCSPALAADAARPLAEPADLARHVLLHLDDEQTSWLDWNLWLHAFGLKDFKPAGALHFSSYDQVIQAAAAGQGIALGRFPLLRRMLREKQLAAPFCRSVASSRAYFLVRSTRTSGKPDVAAFADWLQEETGREALAAQGAARPKKKR